MGWFGSSRNNNSNSNSESDKDDTLFKKQNIRCKSEVDKKTIKRLHDALYEDNLDTCNDDNMKDALSSLDANVYNLFKAVIYQNFMLQRRIEELSDKVDQLSGKNSTAGFCMYCGKQGIDADGYCNNCGRKQS